MIGRQSGRRATINDVARAANVSRQTVSNAVNRPDRVAPPTLRRVQAEIARLGYHPSAAAKSLREQRAGAVGIELDARGGAAGAEIALPLLAELAVAARDHGAHLVTFAHDRRGLSAEVYESMVLAHVVDAFVLPNTYVDDPRPAWLRALGVPFVTYGRLWDEPGFTAWCDVDGRAGTWLAVEHLVEAGYARIGWVGWPGDSGPGVDRAHGWQDAAARLGVLGADLVERCEQDLASAHEAGARMAGRLRPGDALVCVSDLVALGVRAAVVDAGLTPGQDIGIVGFDGTGTAAMLGLTTVEQPVEQIAENLLVQVRRLLADEDAPSSGLLLTPRLRTAASTRRT